MMARLWLVRHGETDWNVEGRWQGQAAFAPPLNAVGRAQTHALAAQLDGQSFEALYSSDLLRARETADIIAARLRLPVRLEPRLREVNLGRWEGMLGEDIARQYPAELLRREHDPLHARPPGGESVTQVAARVGAAVDDMARAHPAGLIVVVSHGLSLATLVCRARGLPLEQAYSVIPPHARPDVIEWDVHPMA
jgi:broad specificity phosphatase PhoE